MMGISEVFRLEPFKADPLDRTNLGHLPPITPRFSLPSLEDGNGADRLLAGLRGSLERPPRNGAQISSKGKEREDPKEELLAINELLTDEGAFWLNVAQGEPGPSQSRLNKPRMWDALRDPLAGEDPVFLSEAPIFAFDALISTDAPRVDQPHLKTACERRPTASAELLKLVMQATLGNVTTGGVKWVPKEHRFAWAAEGGRAVGLQQTTTSSAIREFLKISTCLRRLELTVDSLTPRPMTLTHHSLLHGLSTCLTYVKQRLTASIERRSGKDKAAWNRCSSELKDIRALLVVLCDIIQWPLDQNKPVPLSSRATSLLTHLHAHLLARMSTSSPAQNRADPVLALAYLLKISSEPLVALLHQWVGLSANSPADENVDPDAQPWSDLGITRHSMPMSKQEPRWEYTFSSSKMPGFIPKADRRTLFEAGRSLRLLREASGGRHPLCGGGWEVAGSWAWGEEKEDAGRMRTHSRRVQKETDAWQRSTKGNPLPSSMSHSSSVTRLRQPRKHRKSLPTEFMPIRTTRDPSEVTVSSGYSITNTEKTSFDPIWSLVNQVPGTHLSTGQTTSLWSPTPVSELDELIQWHSDPTRPLLSEDAPTLPQHITSHLLAPLLVHSNLVSTALVSLYLDSLGFLEHLDVLRAYWLGEDVTFLERVNGALFGKDSAGAGEALGMGKRARTRARLGLGRDGDRDNEKAEEQREWGIGLGIGLSERTKWPPGGAELTYALRTAMVDDEREVVTKGEVWEGIEDKVSYAIQDLPEDQKDGRTAKWLNPQAIEALDFLYLAYSSPPTIAVLLPRNLMEKYQSVHNLLLRLGRVETVLRSMFIDIHHAHDLFDEPVKSGVDARDRRPKSHVRQERQRSGIFPVGSKEEKRLWHLRYRMSHVITTFSRYILDTAIGGNWQVLRNRLRRLQKRTSTGTQSSRPGTPSTAGHEDENEGYFAFDDLDLGQEDDEDEESQTQQLHQLHSIHSLVLYHHLIMDRIMRSCLLHPSSGYQVAFKILMTLFGICLDFAKTVKEVEKGLLGWMDGAEKIEYYWREWVEKETVFLLAVDRLSKRTPTDNEDVENDNRDLEMLLQGERDGGAGSERDGLVLGRQGADLQELVLRIRLS